VKYKSIEISF